MFPWVTSVLASRDNPGRLGERAIRGWVPIWFPAVPVTLCVALKSLLVELFLSRAPDSSRSARRDWRSGTSRDVLIADRSSPPSPPNSDSSVELLEMLPSDRLA